MTELLEFLKKSKTAFHAVENIAALLRADGYERLYESEEWNLAEGGKYYVIRGGSSIVAFRNMGGGFMIAASHSDSPCFRIKGDAVSAGCLKLETERYGGMINYTWLDRPLTVSGRVTVHTDSGVKAVTVDIGDKKVVIPSLAIHLNRGVNDGASFNPATELLPLAAIGTERGALKRMIAASLGVNEADIVSEELYLTSAEEPVLCGLGDELILSPRLDDLACAYASIKGFLGAQTSCATPVLAVFDNEEVGSQTKQGAASTLLYDTLYRISGSTLEYLKRVASSFLVSADNAHAMHPNRPEMSDRSNAPVLGGGVVLKHNANQRYITDGVSEAVFSSICSTAGVKLQSYYNRADLPGGSTLGSIANTQVSLPGVDIGLPQLAMHSACECCAVADVESMITALTAFFGKAVEMDGEQIVIK
ncbi:MAG: M18 family aminopeptidase [Ruminococcaceae bacterium]|nr:M18 family aminopeptidase [Oscillospiraceae bacterium]